MRKLFKHINYYKKEKRMKELLRKDILDILRDSIKAIKKSDIADLRELSNHTIHSSAIYQEEDSTAIAVVIYSLFKIYGKKQQPAKDDKAWSLFNNEVLGLLESAYKSLITANLAQYKISIKKIFSIISKFEKAFGKFVTEVIEQSKIKKGSQLVDHGLSIGRTAELLGISSWDLMEYLGVTNFADEQPKTISERDRLRTAEVLFR